jgi:hypothetical protein
VVQSDMHKKQVYLQMQWHFSTAIAIRGIMDRNFQRIQCMSIN